MPTDIHYKTGDATLPMDDGNKIIAHICNDVGGWGRGFVMAISNRWKEPEEQYREWYATIGVEVTVYDFTPSPYAASYQKSQSLKTPPNKE